MPRDLMVRWRSTRSLPFHAMVAVAALLLAAQLWAGGKSATSDSRGRELFSLIGYGTAAVMLLWAPAVAVGAIAGDRTDRHLLASLHAEPSRWRWVRGQCLTLTAYGMTPVILTLPVAMACYAVGRSELAHVVRLHGLLTIVALQICATALMLTAVTATKASALRCLYAAVGVLAVYPLAPFVLASIGVRQSIVSVVEFLSVISPLAALVSATNDSGRLISEAPVGAHVWVSVLWSGLCLLVAHRCFDPNQLIDRSRARRQRGSPGFLRRWPVLYVEVSGLAARRGRWFMATFAATMVVSFSIVIMGSREPTPTSITFMARILIIVGLILVTLAAPGLCAPLIAVDKQEQRQLSVRMCQATPIRLILMRLILSLASLLLLLLAVMPALYLIQHLDITDQWAPWRVSGVLALYATAMAMLSGAVGGFFRSADHALVGAYTVIIAICVGMPMLVVLGALPFQYVTDQVRNLSPVLLVLDITAMDHGPKLPMSASAGSLFASMALAGLLIMLWQVWRTTQPN